MYLPFLMVSLPSSGSRTGSMLSPMFSRRRQSPLATALSIKSRYLKKLSHVQCHVFITANSFLLMKITKVGMAAGVVGIDKVHTIHT